MNPHEMRALMRSRISAAAKQLALLCFISASRVDDVTRCSTLLTMQGGAVLMTLGTSKTDWKGVGSYKYLTHGYAAWCLQHHLQLKPCITYRQLVAEIQRVNPILTGHSFRRGAATTLASQGVSNSRIAFLSGHATTRTKNERGVNSYVQHHRHQPFPRLQRSLSNTLYTQLFRRGTSEFH